jgi:hypothetical protein
MAGTGETGRDAPEDDADESGWRSAYLSWRRGRLDRVQASARVWLGVLTTLLGLLGSVVLFKGGDLVTGITGSGWFQFFLICLVGLVFASAVLALIAGGAATWGGLGDVAPAAALEIPAAPASQAASGSGQKADVMRPWRTRLRLRWFGFWLVFTGEPAAGRRALLTLPTQRELTHLEPWEQYRRGSLNSADRRRAYLHASRTLGVVTAVLIAVLAVLAIIGGTVAPAPDYVLVIHNGRTACVPAAATAKFTHVSQVITVSGC